MGMVFLIKEKEMAVWFPAGHGSAGMAYHSMSSHFQPCPSPANHNPSRGKGHWSPSTPLYKWDDY